MSTDRIIESARRVAAAWKQVDLDDISRDALGKAYEALVPTMDLLDELADRCSAPIHRTWARPHTPRGRAENGWQPEPEFYWGCSCIPEEKSGDMLSAFAAIQAAEAHEADPTQFPGWLS